MSRLTGEGVLECGSLIYCKHMEEITIYTDGASKGNPGRGGWGALVANSEVVCELGGNESHTTNNRMELMAAIEALRYAATLPVQPIALHTDSSYVIHGITKWVQGWQSRGWITKEKKEVLNQDLWQALVAAKEACKSRVDWRYVGGHIGVVGNERVDAIASDFAVGEKVVLYCGPRAGYAIDITVTLHNEEKKEKKAATKNRSNAKAYSYVSRVDGTTQVHKTWGECEARVRGKHARFKKATSAAEEAAIVKDFSTS